MQTYYEKRKKERIDICNICGLRKTLTWEHVPPQCCDNVGEYKINRVFDVGLMKEKLDSQNGIKYRTICSYCNNTVLGSIADQEFKKFYDQVNGFIGNAKDVKDTCNVKINVVQVLKCIFGKVLAMDEVYQEDKISFAMRNFILKDTLNKDLLHVYFWIYPYNSSMQVRLHVNKQVGGIKYGADGLISLLYFYPLAFIISDKKENLRMKDLMDYVDFNNQNVELEITPEESFNPYTGKVLPYNFLNIVDNNHVILTNRNNTNSVAYKKIK